MSRLLRMGGRRRVRPAAPVLAPAIFISLNNASFTGQQSGTSTRTVTVTPANGFTGAVTFEFLGLPSGTTGSVGAVTIVSGPVNATVTLTHAAGASLVTGDAFTLRATASGVDPADVNATVTVVEPEAEGSFTLSRPVGMTTAADTTFDATFDSSDVISPTDYDYGGFRWTKFAGSKLTVVEAASSTSGTGYTAAHKTPSGQTAGYMCASSPMSFPADQTKLYSAVALMMSDPYQFDNSNVKLFYPKMRTDGGANLNSFVLGLRAESASTVFNRCSLQLGQVYVWNGSTFTDFPKYENANGYSNANRYWLNTNTRYRIEIYAELETPGLGDAPQDGIVRVWISTWNGASWNTPVLIMEYTDLRVGPSTPLISKVWSSAQNNKAWEPYQGGATGPAPAADQFIYVDRLHVSYGV